jgi:hypothetical protein
VERRHELEAAIGEYDRLLTVYSSLGYEIIILPKVSVSECADFILRTLSEAMAGFRDENRLGGRKPLPPPPENGRRG